MDPQAQAKARQRKQRVAEIFDGAAPTYGQVGPAFFSYFGRRMVEIAAIRPHSTVLDVATGRGAVLYPASKAVGPHGNIIGIDLSAHMLRATTIDLAADSSISNVELRLMDAENLQFGAETFDYVLCGFAIFFFPQLDQAMAAFQRVLKPGGKLCVSTFDASFYVEWQWLSDIVAAYISLEPEADSKRATRPEAQPVFETPAGVTAILDAAGFIDTQVVTESAEFVYASGEEFWSTLWSHGARETLERIAQERGADGLQQFKTDVLQKIDALKQTDGLHQQMAVHIGVASKRRG